MLIEEIRNKAAALKNKVISYRRHLHKYPELSFQEFKTAAFIKEKLDEMGIPWKPVAETGVIARIEGGLPSKKVIALRADIDALPIEEKNQLEYASVHNGVMHACGHDMHTASLLGCAEIIQEMRSHFGGIVKLIFQPGEEKLPGGAPLVINDEEWKKEPPEIVIGQHVMPALPSGKIGIRSGKFMASMDEIFIEVQGKGGHGAMPHQNIDPVVIAATIIVALQQVVSRMSDPTIPTVLSIGKLEAKGAINVIPDTVLMEGTFRTLDENRRNEAHEQIKKIAGSIAEGMGGICTVKINKGYPSLYNEEGLSTTVTTAIEAYIGKENIIPQNIWMASEDFAYYAQQTKGCFYLLGTGNMDKNSCASLHTPFFNIDEEVAGISTGIMACIALQHLNGPAL